jgi:organic hydroperoxide reductase OsmC/OhrA
VESVLERIDGGSQFARYTTRATLTVPSGADEATARKLLEKAENGCLIANSLRGMAKRQAPRNG